MKACFVALCALLAASSASAADYEFKPGEPIALRSDSAYVLVRTSWEAGGALRGTVKYSPILIRELSDQELASVQLAFQKNPFVRNPEIEPNVVQPSAKHPYFEASGTAFLFMSLKPGRYLVGGATVTNWALKDEGATITCLCMGTVMFEAKPGVVTDLGTLLVSRDDTPTNIPELAGVISGKPRGFGPVLPQIAIRPATADTEKPAELARLNVVAAGYEPVGEIRNYLGARISRLAPIPGVLNYDQSGKIVKSIEPQTGSLPSASIPQ